MIVALGLGAVGVVFVAAAIWNERRMQQHRQPGVSYGDVTWRRDGGWRRPDLFTERGLAYQRRASAFGFTGLGMIIAALVLLAIRGP